MLKLYRHENGSYEYWETWDKDSKTGVIHWGVVGEKGSSKEIKSTLFKDFHKVIQEEINIMLQKGFLPIHDENMRRLLIEYKIDGHGTESDLIKRHTLESRMNETLGWTGLGHCDGGSIGAGTMDVCCFVVNFEIAKNVIEDDLRNTEFGNYQRLYDEDNQ